jgi:hypothetical protein
MGFIISKLFIPQPPSIFAAVMKLAITQLEGINLLKTERFDKQRGIKPNGTAFTTNGWKY